jgi:hypothetical protein
VGEGRQDWIVLKDRLGKKFALGERGDNLWMKGSVGKGLQSLWQMSYLLYCIVPISNHDYINGGGI